MDKTFCRIMTPFCAIAMLIMTIALLKIPEVPWQIRVQASFDTLFFITLTGHYWFDEGSKAYYRCNCIRSGYNHAFCLGDFRLLTITA